MGKVYPLRIDGATYEVTVNSGVLDFPTWLVTGAGDPEGVVTAAIGTVYSRTDGARWNTLYIKETGAGNTGWARAATTDVTDILEGSGTPEGFATAPVGSVYRRTNGTPNETFYIKETGAGSTGWSIANTSIDTIFIEGTGSPEGVEAAGLGSLFRRTDGGIGTTLYIKEEDDGANTGWKAYGSVLHTVAWPMGTSASSGRTYSGGFYAFGGTANDFDTPAVTFGTANGSYAAHLMLVAASGATDTVVTVEGTSILDDGTRTETDSEDIPLTNASADTYYETTKKWIGQVTITKTAGTDRLCNYGFCKYWDNANTDFTVTAFEALWSAIKTDAGFDVQIHKHSATGWTYNAGAEPDPPVTQSMSGTHATERSSIAGEQGAFKRTSAGVSIEGSGSEGILFSILTTTTNVLNYGSIEIWYTD